MPGTETQDGPGPAGRQAPATRTCPREVLLSTGVSPAPRRTTRNQPQASGLQLACQCLHTTEQSKTHNRLHGHRAAQTPSHARALPVHSPATRAQSPRQREPPTLRPRMRVPFLPGRPEVQERSFPGGARSPASPRFLSRMVAAKKSGRF